MSIQQFENDIIKVEFAPENGGFPSRICLKSPDGDLPALKKTGPFLNIELSDGRLVSPFLPDGFTVTKHAINGAERIQFDTIPFRDQHGKIAENFLLSLRYEFWDDGTVFVRTYFTVDSFLDRPGIRGFKFNVPLDLGRFAQIHQPGGLTPNMTAERMWMKPFTDYKFDAIVPSFNFNCSSMRQSAYFEVFMDRGGTLSHDRNDAETTLTWEHKSPLISWNFQKREVSASREYPWEWRTQWGWLFARPPRRRRLPPMRMYHLLDSYDYRVPTLEQLEQIAAAGADTIVLHETWRLDIVSNSFPYNRDRLREFIAEAHKRDIRIALYVRGSLEDTGATEEFCDWFKMYLTKNYDGIYMDFGGARNGSGTFRAHYLKMRRIREEIGAYGLFYSHTGSLTTAVGLTPNLIDAYVAGEGENGALTKDRLTHESLSGAYVTTGSMWTAGFPHYGESRMVPFMAASGQYPHAPLGVQFRSSSLAHPNFPGINDIYLRPLWKLWGTLKGQQDLTVLNDFNSCGIFANSDSETGANLMITADRKTALLILSNFRNVKRQIATKINWEAAGFSPQASSMSAFLLKPTTETPGTPAEWKNFADFAAEVEPCGCAGFLISTPPILQKILTTFTQPYPPQSDVATKHAQIVQEQKNLREASVVPYEKLFLKIEVPPPPNTIVCGIAFYNVIHELGTFDKTGAFTLLGYLTMNGLEKSRPKPADIIWAGCASPWIALHELLPAAGRYRIGIKSFSLRVAIDGGYFHSLVEALVAPQPEIQAKNTRRLVFLNEVEPARDTLHFEININPAEPEP